MANRCMYCYDEYGDAPRLGEHESRMMFLGDLWIEWGTRCEHGDQKLLKRQEPDGSFTDWTPNEVWAMLSAPAALDTSIGYGAELNEALDGLLSGEPPRLTDADHAHDTYRDFGANRYE